MGDNKISEAGRVTTGHCKNKAQPGGCHLHNLQCGYPACDRKRESHLQGEAVPVAWQHCGDTYGHIVITASQKDDLKKGETGNQIRKIDAAYSIPLYTHPQPAELSAIPTMADALAAGDGALHGAVEHWQDRALAAERKLAELSEQHGVDFDNVEFNAPPGLTEDEAFDLAIATLEHELGHAKLDYVT